MDKLEKTLNWLENAEKSIKTRLIVGNTKCQDRFYRRVNRTLNKGWDISLSERGKKLRIDIVRYKSYLKTLRTIGI